MRVLICDDHVIFAESLAELLIATGLRVVAVETHPDRAAEVMRRESPDIFLLDVMFEHESVLPRLAEFRRLAPATRIVLLTGRVDADLIALARDARVHGVTDKRCLGMEIVHVLHRVHAGERVFPADARVQPGSSVAPPTEHAQWLVGHLTPRERATLRALVGGDDTRKLARTLGVAPTTARCYIQRVLKKMGAHSRLEAATSAVRRGLINPETGDWL
jgi:two-component system nitrate/nitrite response regulator NarL